MSTPQNSWVVCAPRSPERCAYSRHHIPILGPVRTGILGGTFDPIHIAHLHAAESALYQFKLDRVLLIPAGEPWQKAGRQITEGPHRFEMVRRAVEGVDGLDVDDRELVRNGPTYTVDTLESFPDEEELFLILGADAIARIHTWHRWNDVLDRVNLLIAPRPGGHEFDTSHGESIEMGLLDVSATDIRARAAEDRPFRYLVTGDVHEYITANHLYTQVL